MSGFHIHCGDWHGSDKSGNAFPEVIRDAERFLLEDEEEAWAGDLMMSLEEQEQHTADDDCMRIELSAGMMEVLIGPLQRYHADLSERLGFPDPEETAAGEPARAGDWSSYRWRLVCARELLQAYDVCRRTGDPVVIFWS